MSKLIGNNPNQVPVNADLGDLAYQDGDNATIGPLTVSDSEVVVGTTRINSDSFGSLLVNSLDKKSTEKLRVSFGASSGETGIEMVASGNVVSTQVEFWNNSTNNVGNITTNNSSTSYNTSSDYRLKENVVEMTGSIERVKELKPSQFNFIADPDKTVDGFLAHEAQEVVPEAVTGEKDAIDDEGNPEYQGIDQAKLVPLLTGALKEAILEIESLKARVSALES